MKKLVSLLSILTIAFSLSLTACGNTEEVTPETETDTTTESQPAETE